LIEADLYCDASGIKIRLQSEGDCPLACWGQYSSKRVPRLALVQHIGRIPSQPYVLNPIQRMECALDPSDLAQSKRHRSLEPHRTQLPQNQRWSYDTIPESGHNGLDIVPAGFD
jgi:hypothetical protein